MRLTITTLTGIHVDGIEDHFASQLLIAAVELLYCTLKSSIDVPVSGEQSKDMTGQCNVCKLITCIDRRSDLVEMCLRIAISMYGGR